MRRRDSERRHLFRLQPDPHREHARAEDVGPLHAGDGGEPRLHGTRQVVGDLILVQLLRRKPEVHRRGLVVRRLEIDDRRLRFRRQVVPNLRHLRLDLRERGVLVVVQLQMNRDRADALRAGRLHEVDAVGARDDALERRRQEASNEVGVRADVDGRDLDYGRVAARVLAD